MMKGYTPPKGNKVVGVGLLVVLILQILCMTWMGSQKAGYHLDEMYTYTLSGVSGGIINQHNAMERGYWENWNGGDLFHDRVSVSKEECFNYDMVYENQVLDVHPPLYYFVIHTVASFFPDTFSKWIGVVPNMLFCVLTTIVVFFIAFRLSREKGLALLCCAVWAFSIGAMETAMFIRMYAVLTFWCALLVLLHLKAYDEVGDGEIRVSTWILLGLCTCSGILTQYYFLVFCFFLCGIFFLFLLCIKQWRALWRYVLTEVCALTGSVAAFPAMIKHIFFEYRGEEAFANLIKNTQYGKTLKKVLSLIGKDIMNGWTVELITVLMLLVIAFGLKTLLQVTIQQEKETAAVSLGIQLKLKKEFMILISERTQLMLVLGIIVVGYTMLVAKIAPFLEDRYYMCVYPIAVIVLFHLLITVLRLFVRNKAGSTVLLYAVALLITVSGYMTQRVTYLYDDYSEREKLSAYEEYPAVVVNNGTNYSYNNWIYELQNYDSVYICKANDFSGLKRAVDSRDLSDGFLLYAYKNGGCNETELFEKVEAHLDLTNYVKIVDAGCPVYFCTLEQ